MIDLSNKVALITGGSRGIGAACVRLFTKAGSDVAFTFKSNVDSTEKLISNLESTGKVKSYKVNLESEENINYIAKQITEDFGKIDILINNAGIWNFGKADEMDLTHWNETINVNLTGIFLITKVVIPIMKKNYFGRIINISSTAGQRGEAYHSHYAASKGGIISYTKSLAVELASHNITVNSVAPGWVDTDMCAEVFSDKKFKEKVCNEIPVGRISTAEDIAGPVLFLASDLARQINGEILNVNGGSVLCG